MKHAGRWATIAVASIVIGLPIVYIVYNIAVSGSTPGGGGDRSGPLVSVPRDDVEGLPHFSRVSDALYRGAQPERKGFVRLKEMGVKTIVNLRAIHSDRKDLAGLGFKYVHISFKPWHPEDEDAVAFLEVMTKKGNQPVFVHCKKGVDRTGTMVALYRVVFEGWPMAAAIEEMHQFGRHSVWSNLDHYLRKVDVEALKRKLATDVRQGAEMAEAGIAE